MEKMLLIDGNSLLFRAYYATAYGNVMKTANGIPTNALFGFTSMLLKAFELVNADNVLVAFDTGKKTFRHDKYEEYKGTRSAVPEDLVVQFPIIRELLDAMHIKRCEIVGYEADDIIGSLVKKYRNYDINVLTSDKDLLQLIDDTTSIWLMKKGLTEIVRMDEKALFEQMQIVPDQITDLKGLMGDASDNIPGVKGIGEKTALKLIWEYNTIENLYEHIDEIKGKLQEKLIEGKESALFSKWLATIKCDVEVNLETDDFKSNIHYGDFISFLKKYEVNSILKKIQMIADVKENIESTKTTLEYLEVTKISTCLLKEDVCLYVDYDFEDYKHANLYGFAISDSNKTEYISIENAKNDANFLSWLKLDNQKISYNIKMFYHLAYKNNIEVNGLKFDCMLAAFLSNTALVNYDLIAEHYELTTRNLTEEVYGTESKVKIVDNEVQVKHACERCYDLTILSNVLKTEIKDKNLSFVLYDIEQPLSKVLSEMEQAGINMDITVLDEIAKETFAKIEMYSNEVYELVNKTFNINSPKQLGEVLFDDLGLKTGKKRSTAVDVLEKLQNKHPIVPILMKIRKLQKLYSTYAEGLKKYIEKDGKIHTDFRQNVTQTGRLSSVNPNLQNISIHDEMAREVRKAFTSEKDCLLVASDYSQIELRILAHMANEQSLIEAFSVNMDIHTKTAMDVFGIKEDEVTSEHRRKAKAVNFGIVYGISDFGLSEQLKITRAEAQHYIERYFESYPQIQSFMDKIVNECQTQGYVTTMFERRREIPEIFDKNYMTREFGKRAAMNTPIQGSAADLIKLAMIKISNEMKRLNVKSKMLLQVHDELIFNVYNDEREIMTKLIKEEMSKVVHLKVPLIASYAVGENWYQTK